MTSFPYDSILAFIIVIAITLPHPYLPKKLPKQKKNTSNAVHVTAETTLIVHERMLAEKGKVFVASKLLSIKRKRDLAG